MEKSILNQKGSLVITTLIICLIISTIILCFYNLSFENHISVQSNINSIKAYYLAESAKDILTYELNTLCEELIFNYLTKLREYKLIYLGLPEGEPYNPPNFPLKLRQKIEAKRHSLNVTIENPFSDYSHEHFYKITVVYDISYNIIKAEVIGSYLHAKKVLHIEYSLPYEILEGVDDFNLPKSKIKPLLITKEFQR